MKCRDWSFPSSPATLTTNNSTVYLRTEAVLAMHRGSAGVTTFLIAGEFELEGRGVVAMAHIAQSGAEYGLGFRAKLIQTSSAVPSSQAPTFGCMRVRHRANLAHSRQSGPESGPGVKGKQN